MHFHYFESQGSVFNKLLCISSFLLPEKTTGPVRADQFQAAQSQSFDFDVTTQITQYTNAATQKYTPGLVTSVRQKGEITLKDIRSVKAIETICHGPILQF